MELPQWPDSIFLLPHDFPDKYYFSLTPTLDAKWWLLVLLTFVGGGLWMSVVDGDRVLVDGDGTI